MLLRKRTKGSTLQEEHSILNLTIGGIQSSFPCTSPVHDTPLMEYMEDVVGNLKSEYNPVDHSTCGHAHSACTYFVVGTEETGFNQYSWSIGGLVPSDLSQSLRNIDFTSELDVGDFATSAYLHFSTAVPETSSIANFIIEILQMLEGNVKIALRLERAGKRVIVSFWKIFQRTGNYWVAWSFAVRPFIQDVWAFLNVLKHAEKRVRWLRKFNHRPVKLKYRWSPREINGTGVSIGSSWIGRNSEYGGPLPPRPGELSDDLLDYSGTVRLSSWAHVRFDIPDEYLNDFSVAVGYTMLIMTGLQNPAKIAWEAIPFSWLIEWMTNKKAELIKAKASLSRFPDAEILQIGYSIDIRVNGRTYLKVDSPEQEIDTGQLSYVRYIRRPGSSKDESFINTGGLSPGQLGILTGIASNWRRRRASNTMRVRNLTDVGRILGSDIKFTK